MKITPIYPRIFRVPAVPSIVDPARPRAIDLRSKIKNETSITEGEGTFSGCIFQEAFYRIFGGTYADQYNFDMLMPEGWMPSWPQHHGRFELKAKRRYNHDTNGYINHTWEQSIANRHGLGTGQKCDYYSFASIYMLGEKEDEDSQVPIWIYFLGSITKTSYFWGKDGDTSPQKITDTRRRWNKVIDGAEFQRAGVRYGSNDFMCTADCWNRPIWYFEHYKVTDLLKTAQNKLAEIVDEAQSLSHKVPQWSNMDNTQMLMGGGCQW